MRTNSNNQADSQKVSRIPSSSITAEYDFMKKGDKSSLSNNFLAADQLSDNTKKRTLSGPNN